MILVARTDIFKQEKNSLIVSPKLESLVKLLNNKPELHKNSVIEFLKFGFIIGTKTLLKGIRQMGSLNTITFQKSKKVMKGTIV